jgi:hypothetical protein
LANYRTGHAARSKPETARQTVIAALAGGAAVADACKQANRSYKWYEEQRRITPGFKDAANAAKEAGKTVREQLEVDADARHLAAVGQGKMGPFSRWSETYLGQRVWPVHQNMIDVVEGREPRWLHPGMSYEPGIAGKRRVLINVPPNHAKTMVLSIGYVTYKIVEDPNISVLLVSKTQEMAKKILYGVKQRLTHPRYRALQERYGPEDGWKATADQWAANKVYLGGESRDSVEKDPTIEAVGVGGQIYGARASLIILDDIATLSNANEYAKQDEWLRQEVASRLGPGGQIVVVGTRVASMDIYRHLRDPETYTDGRVPWTYLSMPAVLDYADTPEEWVTLWPETDSPFVDDDEPLRYEEATPIYDRWTGPRLSHVRNEVGPRKWSLVYQQADVADDATFDQLCVRGSIEGARRPGPLQERDGWYVICGMDPAVAGVTAAVAYAVERGTGVRKVLEVRTLRAPSPAQIRGLIEEMTERHMPNEWVIETNAFQGFLARDEHVTMYLASKGIIVRPHHTGTNKQDPDFGVASMAGLFGTRTQGTVGSPAKHNQDNLLGLPRGDDAGTKVLVEELVSWNPVTPVHRRRQDTVMAMWFCETRAREVVQSVRTGSSFHARSSPFLSQRDKERRMVIDLNEYQAQKQAVSWM